MRRGEAELRGFSWRLFGFFWQLKIGDAWQMIGMLEREIWVLKIKIVNRARILLQKGKEVMDKTS